MYDTWSNLAAVTAFLGAFSIFILLICVISILTNWKLFQKAGLEGWIAIIPFYNSYTYYKMCYGEG